jgi:hypothetical protein
MSESEKHAQLDLLIDRAVEEFLLVPNDRILERVEELTGAKESLANEFDRLIHPVLSQTRPNHNSQDRSTSSPASARQKSGVWDLANHLGHVFFSRPTRSVFASLVLIIAGATLSFPLWRATQTNDSSNTDSSQTQSSRNFPKESGHGPIFPTSRGPVFMAQLVKSSSFAVAAEQLDRINARHAALLKDRSLLIRKANDGVDNYLGGVSGLKSESDAEELCVRIRAGGDTCSILKVPAEQ